jgi:hypothetical protein
MSEPLPAGALPPEPNTSDSSDQMHRPERVKVRKRVRVRTATSDREHRRGQWEGVRNVLIYVAIGVGGLFMIWIGLKFFVTDPPLPRSGERSVPGVNGERSLA